MSPASSTAAAEHLPSRGLPLLYLGTGLLSLLVAFAAVAADPRAVAGFFYHPRLLAVVHLVTLGWIGGSVLGSIHLVGPLALRMPLRATRGDYAGFACFAIGVLGMVSHFWLDSPRGMVWSASLATVAFLRAAWRVLPRLLRAPIPPPVKWPVGLAFVNALLAAGLGIVLGLNKVTPFLPVHHLRAVLAHAHLAALGFATMIVMGAGYRLLPMMLPAAMSTGRGPMIGALLVEAGLLGLLASFFAADPVRPLATLLAASGIAVFLGHVLRMLRNRRPPPPERSRPDFAVALALLALASLAATVVLGILLVIVPGQDEASPLAMAYGALALVGFLAPMVVAVQQRLLPLSAWLWAYAGADYARMPTSLHTTPGRLLPALTFAGWAMGAPLLAAALGLEWLAGLRAAALLLLGGTLAHTLGLARTFRRLRVLLYDEGHRSHG